MEDQLTTEYIKYLSTLEESCKQAERECAIILQHMLFSP